MARFCYSNARKGPVGTADGETTMDPKFEPVMSGGTPTAVPPSVDSDSGRRRHESRPAQHVLAAGAVAAADDRRRASPACSSISSRCFKTAPIMTPLLMFGVMLGSLWIVTLLRNSAWGVRRAVRLHVHRRADADADPDGRRGLPQRRAAGRAVRRADGGGVLRARGVRDAYRSAISASSASSCSSALILLIVGIARQPVLPGAGAVDHAVGDRRAALLAVPAATT